MNNLSSDQESSNKAMHPAFAREKFLLAQKHFSLQQKYYVRDENDNAILFVERPSHLLRNLGALLLAVFAGVLSSLAIVGIGAFISQQLERGTVAAQVIGVLVVAFALLALAGVAFVVLVKMSKKRHVTIYDNDKLTTELLKIFQDKKVEFLTATFTVAFPDGQVLALFQKNYLWNLFRKRWYCTTPDGKPLFTAMEDSVLKSILRRLLGPLFGILRTNFVFLKGDGAFDESLGQFNRKFTLRDKYVLDMTEDRRMFIDRRLAVAMAVMLDTGERR
ncbi:MAG: hypothetical protein OEZ28_14670 [Nitrospinota bacterium]|nr:hypothetical protein [Nitrospinota bacterium]